MDNDFEQNNYQETARKDFDRAHFKAYIAATFNRLRRTNNDLLPFDEVRKRINWKGQSDLGYSEVPLDKIIGSVGRYQDFDRAFLPRLTYLRSRWENIDKARLQDISLPPVELYKIGGLFFVKDGNHRVSVARLRDQVFIDAYVTEIRTDTVITPDMDFEQFILEQEQKKFLEETGLGGISAGREIRFTQAGQYDKLLEHISVHRWYMGEKYNHEVAWKHAARSWYRRVYLPLVEIISSMRILAEFPGRSEADLYLWIIEHQYYLAQQSGGVVTAEQAALHYANRYSRRPLRKLQHWLRRAGGVLFRDMEPLPEDLSGESGAGQPGVEPDNTHSSQ